MFVTNLKWVETLSLDDLNHLDECTIVIQHASHIDKDTNPDSYYYGLVFANVFYSSVWDVKENKMIGKNFTFDNSDPNLDLNNVLKYSVLEHF